MLWHAFDVLLWTNQSSYWTILKGSSTSFRIFWILWDTLGYFGIIWDALGCSGMVCDAFWTAFTKLSMKLSDILKTLLKILPRCFQDASKMLLGSLTQSMQIQCSKLLSRFFWTFRLATVGLLKALTESRDLWHNLSYKRRKNWKYFKVDPTPTQREEEAEEEEEEEAEKATEDKERPSSNGTEWKCGGWMDVLFCIRPSSQKDIRLNIDKEISIDILTCLSPPLPPQPPPPLLLLVSNVTVFNETIKITSMAKSPA